MHLILSQILITRMGILVGVITKRHILQVPLLRPTQPLHRLLSPLLISRQRINGSSSRPKPFSK
jgi:hypothetical protein